MIQEEFKELFDELRAFADETEGVEFKKAQSSYDFNNLGKYFSALCNEANLKNQNNEKGRIN